jgi:hypothetical protein
MLGRRRALRSTLSSSTWSAGSSRSAPSGTTPVLDVRYSSGDLYALSPSGATYLNSCITAVA